MGLAVQEFWKLVEEAGLLTKEQCQAQAAVFAGMKGAEKASSAATLAEWLVSERVLSRYQTTVLLAGRPGPFWYGDYCVFDRVDRGRLAGLFRAIHRPTGHKVSLWFVAGMAAQDPAAVARLAQNVQTSSAVASPHVQGCYELVDLGRFRFVVLEELQGQPLGEKLAAGPMDTAEACRWARQLALGLHKLHESGAVHGEVCAHNVWVDVSGNVKLLHVPLWREPFAEPSGAQSPPDRLALMADYLAPEVIAGQAPDARSDIYSLGCVLFEMLTGHAPFAGGDAAAKLRQHVQTPAPSARERRASIPQPVAEVVGYMLAKSPGTRYQQASNVADALAAYVDPARRKAGFPTPTAEARAFAEWRRTHCAVSPVATEASASVEAPPIALVAPPVEPGMAPPVAGQAPGVALAPPVAQAWTGQPVATAPLMATAPVTVPKTAMPLTAVAGVPSGVPVPAMAIPGAGSTGSPVMAAEPLTAVPLSGSGAAPLATPAPMAAPSMAAAIPLVGVAKIAAPAVPKISDERPAAGARIALRRGSRDRYTQWIVLGVCAVVAIGLTWVIVSNFGGRPTNGGGTVAATNTRGSTVSGAMPGDTSTQPGATSQTTSGGTSSGSSGRTTETAAGGTSGTMGGATGTEGRTSSAPGRQLSQVQPVDGDSIWESPTAGPVVELNYLPRGAQCFFVLRPADLVGHPHGKVLLDTLRGLGSFVQQDIPQTLGVPNEKIELLVVGILPAEGKPPKAAWVARLKEPLNVGEWLTALGDPQKEPEKDIYLGSSLGYFLGDRGKLVVAAPIEPPFGDTQRPIDEAVANTQGVVLRPELELLLRHSDSQRAFSCLFATSFLFSGFRPLWQGPQDILREGLEQKFLGDKFRAGLFSLHFVGNEHLFLELHLQGAAEFPELILAKELRAKIKNDLPKQAEEFYISLDPSPYSKKILYRFPKMVQALAEQTDTGIVDKHPVLRCYLPAFAAGSLAEGTYLALVERAGGGGSSAGSVTSSTPPSTQSRGVLEILRTRKMDLTFARDTLEKSIEMVSNEIGVKIVILGSDLQLEGITKNQSFGLDEKDKTAGEILRIIMAKANMDNKLIYVVAKEGDKEILQITTRAAAAARGDKIPPELQLAKDDQPKKK